MSGPCSWELKVVIENWSDVYYFLTTEFSYFITIKILYLSRTWVFCPFLYLSYETSIKQNVLQYQVQKLRKWSFRCTIMLSIKIIKSFSIRLQTYLTTSRLLRRMSAASMATVNGHIAESIAGVSTIRDYVIQPRVRFATCSRNLVKEKNFLTKI